MLLCFFRVPRAGLIVQCGRHIPDSLWLPVAVRQQMAPAVAAEMPVPVRAVISGQAIASALNREMFARHNCERREQTSMEASTPRAMTVVRFCRRRIYSEPHSTTLAVPVNWLKLTHCPIPDCLRYRARRLTLAISGRRMAGREQSSRQRYFSLFAPPRGV